VLVLDAGTGAPAWTAGDLAFGHYSRHTDLVAANGRVLVPTTDGDDLLVRALDERDGTELWRVSLGLAGFSRYDIGPFLAASPETFFVGLSGAVVALDAATGGERFRLDTERSENSGQIALADGALYRRTGLSSLEAYDPVTSQQRWSYRQPFDERRGALRAFGVRDGTIAVYCACDTDREHNSGWLLGVDAATGQERWRVPLDAFIELYQDQPVVGGGMVFTGSEQEDVVARAVGDGAERWRLPRERGQFVATDGTLVYATDRAPRWRHWLVMLGVPWPRA
jgi:outer membrane protein assembly factor BamB